jgi:hypothetical protein
VRVRRPLAVGDRALRWLLLACWAAGMVLILGHDLVRGWTCIGLAVATIAVLWLLDEEED